MKRTQRQELIGLIITILVIILILGSFIIYNYWPILTGKKIILDTAPVDPFDPFRGQYMNIRYEISTIDIDDPQFEKGDTIYILLQQDSEGIYRPIGNSATKPSAGDFIKGEVDYVYSNTVSIDYGIEQYFFEIGTDFPTDDITVEVAIDNSGRAKIIQLLQNNEPIVIE